MVMSKVLKERRAKRDKERLHKEQREALQDQSVVVRQNFPRFEKYYVSEYELYKVEEPNEEAQGELWATTLPFTGAPLDFYGAPLDVHPSSLILSEVSTYVRSKSRTARIRRVESKVRDCLPWTTRKGHGRKSVRQLSFPNIYITPKLAWLSGKIESLHLDLPLIQDITAVENDFNWKRAYFPPTYPDRKKYNTWREAGCVGESPIEGSLWDKTHRYNDWFFVEEGIPSADNIGKPFQIADFALCLGSPKKGKFWIEPKWEIFVSNPQTLYRLP